MKTALITGSTKGIGKQIGIDLLNKGYFVYFTYNKDMESTQILQDELNREGYSGKFYILKSNASRYEEIIRLAKRINAIDILILNVGITDRTPFGTVALGNWNKVINTNLTNPFFLVQELKDKIKPNGKIVFISAILAQIPHARSISYAVTKAGVDALVKNLVKHFSQKKITVNAVAPGFVKTTWHKTKTTNQIKRIEKKIALNRFAEPEEISSLVMEIIKNDYINGQIFTIDGGYDYGEI